MAFCDAINAAARQMSALFFLFILIFCFVVPRSSQINGNISVCKRGHCMQPNVPNLRDE
jgi:hypothetical protein